MLFGILDPEIMSQFSETIHNFLELRKENPEIATVVMWGIGLLLWGLVAYYRRSGQPVTWSDIGKGLEEALQKATHKWEWMYPNNPDNYNIQCVNNGQYLTHYSDSGFCINNNNVMSYLSRREKKELKKLKNHIIKLLEAADAKEQARREQVQKNEVLNSIKQVTYPTRVAEFDPTVVSEVPDIRKVNAFHVPPEITKGRTRAEVEVPDVEEVEEEEVVNIYTQEDFEEVFKTHCLGAEYSQYRDLLAEIMSPEKWRWGLDSTGKPSRNSIRTDKYVWNFNTGICKAGDKVIEFTEFNLPFFTNCVFNLLNHIEYKTLQKVYQAKLVAKK